MYGPGRLPDKTKEDKIGTTVHRLAFKGLILALGTLLFSSAIYGHVLPEIAMLTNIDLSLLRGACYLTVGISLPLAVWYGLLLTRHVLAVGWIKESRSHGRH